MLIVKFEYVDNDNNTIIDEIDIKSCYFEEIDETIEYIKNELNIDDVESIKIIEYRF